jgi:energy-coupling factor transport system substrate-specific component
VSWPLASFAILLVALAGGFVFYERSAPSAKTLALVATLAALAAIGRIAFAPLPNVKPTSDIVMISGFALGGAPGFAVGALAALASNVFFGQGPWTPWQMGAWGAVGIGGAALGRLTGRRAGRATLAAAGFAAGIFYGVVLNFSTFVTFSGDHTLAKFLAISGTALPFDLAHAIGNALFALAFGPALTRALLRFRERATITWRPAPALAVAAALAVACAALAARPQAASAGTPFTYTLSAQNLDGGFGPARGARSSQLYTGWAALGLAAAGRNPLDVRRAGGRSVIDSMRANSAILNDPGELERTILVLAAAGLSPRTFGGHDLVAALDRRRLRNGSIANMVNLTAFGLMALRATGRSPVLYSMRAMRSYMLAQQNADGGYNFAGRGGPSGVDDTAAAVEGLAAGGYGHTAAATRAIAFLGRNQNPDGGFPLVPHGASNAQSTAFVIGAYTATGRNAYYLHRFGARSPIAYLRTLTSPLGLVRYSRFSAQTPVWVSSQALLGLYRKALPIARVPRRIATRALATGSAAAAPSAAAAASGGSGNSGDAAKAGVRDAPRGSPLLRAAGAAGLAAGILMAPVS